MGFDCGEREQARMMRGMGRAVAMMLLMEGCLGDLYLHVSVFFPDRRRQMGCLPHENLLAVAVGGSPCDAVGPVAGRALG